MKKDLAITFFNYAFVFVCGLVVYKVAAKGFGPAGFGEYALARRAVSFLQPILLMGLSVGLVRYIAISSAKEAGRQRAVYILAGFGVVSVFSLALMAVVNAMPGLFSKMVFGKPGYEGMVLSISFLAESYVFNSLVFAYYRGMGIFMKANAIMTLSQGVIPLAALLVAPSVKVALDITSAAIVLSSVYYTLPIIRDLRANLGGAKLGGSVGELVRYGTVRIPGDLSMAGMLALPAFLTSNIYGIQEAGYMAFGISLVNMVGAIFGPIGFVTLPRLSAILAAGKHEDARVIMKQVILYTVLISTAVTALIVIFADFLVTTWLGPKFTGSADIIRVAVLASVPHALYVSLRSSIDAAYVKAINAANVYKALIVSLLCYLVVKVGAVGIIGIPLAFAAGFSVLAALTTKVALETYGLQLRPSFGRTRE
ncbi:MAG TPA: hypothetical protein VGK71_05300 [Nitrospirota bacterium]|jgi:O-antigen/teichoic acid export membrane protein